MTSQLTREKPLTPSQEDHLAILHLASTVYPFLYSWFRDEEEISKYRKLAYKYRLPNTTPTRKET